ncbi:MAG TPA: CBS domain-containing protein [Thermoplasmata archaeon]|nr:CBS domain-containing protein [Thermoplasmata archaeon]
MSLTLARPATVADVMSAPVYSLDQEDTLKEAAVMLSTARISGAPVVDGSGKLVGILTEADILRALEGEAEKAKLVPEEGYAHVLKVLPYREIAPKVLESLARAKVRDVMSHVVVTAARGTSLDEAAREMTERGVNRLPVVEDDRVIGIISRADIVKALARFHTGT